MPTACERGLVCARCTGVPQPPRDTGSGWAPGASGARPLPAQEQESPRDMDSFQAQLGGATRGSLLGWRVRDCSCAV